MGISPMQTKPLSIQDGRTQRDKYHAISGIRTHGLSDQAIKTYVSDGATPVTNPVPQSFGSITKCFQTTRKHSVHVYQK
jgi:hypothetical protein